MQIVGISAAMLFLSLFLPCFLRSRPAALARLEAQCRQEDINFAQMVRNILAQSDEFACVAAVLPRIIIAGLTAAAARDHRLRRANASRDELALETGSLRNAARRPHDAARASSFGSAFCLDSAALPTGSSADDFAETSKVEFECGICGGDA